MKLVNLQAWKTRYANNLRNSITTINRNQYNKDMNIHQLLKQEQCRKSELKDLKMRPQVSKHVVHKNLVMICKKLVCRQKYM